MLLVVFQFFHITESHYFQCRLHLGVLFWFKNCWRTQVTSGSSLLTNYCRFIQWFIDFSTNILFLCIELLAQIQIYWQPLWFQTIKASLFITEFFSFVWKRTDMPGVFDSFWAYCAFKFTITFWLAKGIHKVVFLDLKVLGTSKCLVFLCNISFLSIYSFVNFRFWRLI